MGLLVLLVGGVWHGALTAEFQDYADEAVARDAAGGPFDHAEYNRRYEASQVPAVIAFWTALPLVLAGIMGLHAHWSAPRPHPWLRSRAGLLWSLAGILAATAVLGALRALDPEALVPVQAATGLLLPAAALVWSLLAGYWLAQRSTALGGGIRTGLAWTTAAASFCALLMVVVLVPDPTSEDLAFFAVPALALSGMLAIGFMAMGIHRSGGRSGAEPNAAAAHDKP